MSHVLSITRAGPLVTVQDAGRFGMLTHGISASGPMDRAGFALAGQQLGGAGAALEFTRAGLAFRVTGGSVHAAFAGGVFRLVRNGEQLEWPAAVALTEGDDVEITPGDAGNYGYVRFDREIDVPPVLGSRSTNLIVGLGGHEGRALKASDALGLVPLREPDPDEPASAAQAEAGSIRITWGLHADLFDAARREEFCSTDFEISARMDRMGVRLDDIGGVFGGVRSLSLVSDAVVPGDIQILGDGTPIVLMRDHQPTGGYPRIATIISADLDRFAQLRSGTRVRFASVTVDHAHRILMTGNQGR